MTSILPFKPKTHAVVGFYIKENKILLGKRLESSTNLGLDLYAGIGGKVEQNEDSLQALEREFLEEIKAKPTKAIKIGQVSFVFLHKDKDSKWNMVVDVYKIEELDKKPMPTKAIEPVFFDINNLPYKNMWPDNFYWIHLVINGQNFTGEFVYQNAGKLKELLVRLE